jgi:hypothetical protein
MSSEVYEVAARFAVVSDPCLAALALDDGAIAYPGVRWSESDLSVQGGDVSVFDDVLGPSGPAVVLTWRLMDNLSAHGRVASLRRVASCWRVSAAK